MLVSIPLKKLQKSDKKGVSTFDYNFFEGIFCSFFNGFELSIEFCVYDTHITNFFLLLLALFANFKAKTVWNNSKKIKICFINVF
jgi:hypothetical protein